MKQPPDHLFAWFLEGEDSFIAILIDGLWYPMIRHDEKKALALQPQIKDIVKESGKSAVLRSYKFEKIVGGIG